MNYHPTSLLPSQNSENPETPERFFRSLQTALQIPPEVSLSHAKVNPPVTPLDLVTPPSTTLSANHPPQLLKIDISCLLSPSIGHPITAAKFQLFPFFSVSHVRSKCSMVTRVFHIMLHPLRMDLGAFTRLTDIRAYQIIILFINKIMWLLQIMLWDHINSIQMLLNGIGMQYLGEYFINLFIIIILFCIF